MVNGVVSKINAIQIIMCMPCITSKYAGCMASLSHLFIIVHMQYC